MQASPSDIAFKLIAETSLSVFVTGKAGTGKTTLLHRLQKELRKNFVVLAPTGVAAIRAGGMTLHSFFHLPIGTYIPRGNNRLEREGIYDTPYLIKRLRLRGDQIKLLRKLDTVFIDEVSMVRADVLDAIDTVLRHVRQIQEPFGGVQMVFFGDLFQLAPVIQAQEWQILRGHYNSGYFFDALVWERQDLKLLELTTIYRQQDPEFIRLLNAVRNNQAGQPELRALNVRATLEKPEEGTLILSTHNKSVDDINQLQLGRIPGKPTVYQASIEGTFPPSMFPMDPILELKVNAQVMFIKNDVSLDKRYFNGKIAKVLELESDKIKVSTEENPDGFWIAREAWDNKMYQLDAQGALADRTLGRFTHFPLRLAWAVTIHKSQGLTFDKVRIDAAKAFASGQVYVALSRCRSLEGISLSSPIPPEAIQTDPLVVAYMDGQQIMTLEDFEWDAHRRLEAMRRLKEVFLWKQIPLPERLESWPENTAKTWVALKDWLMKADTISQQFLRQMTEHVNAEAEPEAHLLKRATDAIVYFFTDMEKVVVPLAQKLNEVPGPGDPDVAAFMEQLEYQLERMEQVALFNMPLKIKAPLSLSKALQAISVPNKKTKGGTPTVEQTLEAFRRGLDAEAIAKERDLKVSTINKHLLDLAVADKIAIDQLLKPQVLREGLAFLSEKSDLTTTDLVQMMSISFEEARLIRAAYIKKSGPNKIGILS
jgi:ATP-dependent DNA helicase PIF1